MSSLSGVETALLRVVGVCVDIVSPGAYFARYRLREDPLESPDEGSKLARIVGKTSLSVVFRGVGVKGNRPTVFIEGSTGLKCTDVKSPTRTERRTYGGQTIGEYGGDGAWDWGLWPHMLPLPPWTRRPHDQHEKNPLPVPERPSRRGIFQVVDRPGQHRNALYHDETRMDDGADRGAVSA